MRDFSWQYFAITGDVDAYLLYKEANDKFQNEFALAEELTVQEEVE